jgi:polyhydroxyalkanoate synthesis regulator phasin
MNPFTMMKDAKNMEKMMKPALEKFMKDAGFVKKEELETLKRRISELEAEVSRMKS